MNRSQLFSVSLALGATFFAGALSTAHAQVTNAPIFFVNVNTQDQNGVTSNYWELSGQLAFNNPGDVTSGSLVTPNATYDFTQVPTATTWFAGSPAYSTEAEMNAALPTGTYTTNYTNADSSTGSVDHSYTGDEFSNTPEFSQASYDELQGISTTTDHTITSNSMTVNSTSGDVFFDIFQASTGDLVYSQSFLPSTTDTFDLPSGALDADTAYDAELIFSDRNNNNDANNIDNSVNFDTDTIATFTTAPTPEASSVASFGGLMLLGALPLAAKKLRLRKQN